MEQPHDVRPGTPSGNPPGTPPSALPSTGARVAAFAAIIVAGLCGGLIGFAFADLQCEGSCGAITTTFSLLGAIVAAAGVAVVAVLVLRAMGEWAGDRERFPELGDDR